MTSKLKRVAVLILSILMVFNLTGCADLSEGIKLDITNAVDTRLQDNLRMLEQLHKAGFLSTTLYEDYKGQLEKNFTQLSSDITEALNGKTEKFKHILGAISDFHYIPTDTADPDHEEKLSDGTILYYDCNLHLEGTHGFSCPEADGFDEGMLQSTFGSNFLVDFAADDIKKYPVTTGGEVTPVNVVPNSLGEDINERMGYKIYVLKEELPPGTSLDTVHKLLEEINKIENLSDADSELKLEDGKTVSSALGTYFTPVLDSAGNTVPLLDVTKHDNQIISTSIARGQTITENDDGTIKVSIPGHGFSDKSDDKGYGCIAVSDYNYPYGSAGNKNKPGRDLLISYKMGSKTVPYMAIKLIEFNEEAFDNIVDKVGLDENRYFLYNNGTEPRAYLLQYPVGYVSRIVSEKDSSGSEEENFFMKIDKSDLELNLLTGKTLKKNSTVAASTSTSTSTSTDEEVTEVSSVEPRYHFGDSVDTEASSFIIEGKTGLTSAGDLYAWDLKYGQQNVTVSIPKIVLRDYLEGSFSPGVVGTENVVLYGRMIRITQFSGKSSDIMAKYIDSYGHIVDDTAQGFSFRISDFSDMAKATKGATQSSPTGILYNMRLPVQSSERQYLPATYETSHLTDYDIDPVRMSDLHTLVTDSDYVEPTEKFPSQTIGSIDLPAAGGVDQKPCFYVMLTNPDLHASGTMKWIISSSETENSTRWWNSWLTKNGFSYQIGLDEAAAYLNGHYKYELGQEGILVLDLKTLGMLADQFKDQNNTDVIATFRTFTKLLGYSLLVYGIFLCVAWLFDTNLSPGVQLLQKASFGRLIAVTSESEMPTVGDDKGKYTELGGVVKVSLAIIILGLILLLFDGLDMIYWFTEKIGSISVRLMEFIRGGVS